MNENPTEEAAEPLKPTDLLDADECKVLDNLVAAWNGWLKLERLHPDENAVFRGGVNYLQQIVMARPVQRQFNAAGNTGAADKPHIPQARAPRR